MYPDRVIATYCIVSVARQIEMLLSPDVLMNCFGSEDMLARPRVKLRGRFWDIFGIIERPEDAKGIFAKREASDKRALIEHNRETD